MPAGTTIDEGGDCVVFTTAHVSAWSGGCTSNGAGCDSAPCSPTVTLHSSSSNADGARVSGGIDNMTFGPLRMGTGPDVDLYRGTVTVKCGSTSDYYFWVTTICPGDDQLDYVAGSFACSSCSSN